MDRAELKLDLGLFAISACVLTLQVLQTKIFAFSLDAVTIYLAISICMLGLGASATLLALLPQASPDSVRTTSAVAAALGALAVLESHRVFALYAPGMAEGGLAVYTILIALALPYFCFGIVIALQLIARGTAIGRAYAFNLAGSALGCLIVFPLIDGLGAEAGARRDRGHGIGRRSAPHGATRGSDRAHRDRRRVLHRRFRVGARSNRVPTDRARVTGGAVGSDGS